MTWVFASDTITFYEINVHWWIDSLWYDCDSPTAFTIHSGLDTFNSDEAFILFWGHYFFAAKSLVFLWADTAVQQRGWRFNLALALGAFLRWLCTFSMFLQVFSGFCSFIPLSKNKHVRPIWNCKLSFGVCVCECPRYNCPHTMMAGIDSSSSAGGSSLLKWVHKH